MLTETTYGRLLIIAFALMLPVSCATSTEETRDSESSSDADLPQHTESAPVTDAPEEPSGNEPLVHDATKPVILGSLDKEEVRKVVRAKMDGVRFCYESELAKGAEIEGRVVMKWIIREDGSVPEAKVESSEMNSAAVETCLAERIATWRFPIPPGGGIVVVSYPFIFKRSK